jgi:hypothetical protein
MTPFITATWTLVAGVVVLLLPGLAWLAFFYDPEQDAFERLAETLGVSIALSAIIALLAFLLGLQLSSWIVITIYGLMAFPAFWALRRWWRARTWGLDNIDQQGGETSYLDIQAEEEEQTANLIQGKLVYLSLALVFLVVLLWRFNQIQEVVLPLWVDSVHHVQIVLSFLENGGIPETLEPLMPVPFYYHYAFHALAAVFSFITRLEPPDVVLYLGQVLNAAVALAVYRLGKALWGDWRKAILSALLVGFVTQMPAYYVTWGRYTLLTGMVLLPLAMAAALDIVNKGVKKSRLFTFGLLTAGILVTHYFAAALLAIFLLILGVQVLVENIRSNTKPVWGTWLPLLAAAVLGFLAAGPWLYRMWGYAQARVDVVTIQPNLESIDALYFPDYLPYLWRLLGPDRNQFMLFAALPGLIISLLRKQTRAFGVWTIVLVLLSLPAGFYVAPFRPDHGAIVLFMPTALLVAELLVSIIDWGSFKKQSTLKIVAVLVVFTALVGWGIFETRSVINSSTILATRDDLEALNWIEENTPLQSRFGINVTLWQSGSYRGVDGGWWITPLTGRAAWLPNGLYGLGEGEFIHRVNEVAGQVSQLTGCSAEFWEIVQAEEVSHIYLSANRGSMQPKQFEDCPGVALIFQNESVYLFRIEYIIKPDSG